MRQFRVAVIPGDGIGAEVMREGERILLEIENLHGGISFGRDAVDWGCEYYTRTGKMMPDDGLARLADADAILLGAVGFPGVPDHVSLRGLLLPIRQSFDQYINLRPIRMLEGLASPLKLEGEKSVDFVVVRENTEGEYCGVGRMEQEGTGEEVAVQEARFSRKGTARAIRYAFEYARRHGKHRLVSATKSNALNYSMVFWDRVFEEIRGDYPEIASQSVHVDALAGRFVIDPAGLEVVVASNLFGDILTDLGSAILGSIGISPSANINPEKQYPSMFEPIHGSAPDIAGRGIANPIGMVWSISMMLDHLGLPESSDLLMGAMAENLRARRVRTPDLGGTGSTRDVADDILRRLR